MTDSELAAIAELTSAKMDALGTVSDLLLRRDELLKAITICDEGDEASLDVAIMFKRIDRPHLRLGVVGSEFRKSFFAAVLTVLRERLAALDDELATKAQSL